MLIPKKLPTKYESVIYMAVCSLHGFLYGTFYAVFQAFAYNLGFKGMIAWIISGIPFDVSMGVGNFTLGILILPLIKTLRRANRSISLYQ